MKNEYLILAHPKHWSSHSSSVQDITATRCQHLGVTSSLALFLLSSLPNRSFQTVPRTRNSTDSESIRHTEMMPSGSIHHEQTSCWVQRKGDTMLAESTVARGRAGVCTASGWKMPAGPEFPDCSTAQVRTEPCLPRYHQPHDQWLASGRWLVSTGRGCPFHLPPAAD